MNEQEFIKFYREYADSLFRHCFFKTSDRERAKDFVQETFTRVWSFLSEGGQLTNPKAFLYRTAGNLIIDWYRKAKPVSLDEALEAGFDPGLDLSAALVDQLDGRRAMENFMKLEPIYREALSLRFVEDLAPKEIAEILEVSENVVSVRIHRAIKKLREILENKNAGTN